MAPHLRHRTRNDRRMDVKNPRSLKNRARQRPSHDARASAQMFCPASAGGQSRAEIPMRCFGLKRKLLRVAVTRISNEPLSPPRRLLAGDGINSPGNRNTGAGGHSFVFLLEWVKRGNSLMRVVYGRSIVDRDELVVAERCGPNHGLTTVCPGWR